MSDSSPPNSPPPLLKWALVTGAVLLVIFVAWMMRTPSEKGARVSEPEGVVDPGVAALTESASTSATSGVRTVVGGPKPVDGVIEAPAKQIVTAKLNQFARVRRDIVGAMANQFKIQAPPEVGKFFDAVQSGDWDKVSQIWRTLQELRRSDEPIEGLERLWPALVETFGAAEAVHTWNPQQLLDYGNAILGSLPSGMVYLGGTDAGRFIPTLLNEQASNDSKRVILTQSAFADVSYLQYASFLYGDRVAVPTADDSQRAFQEYLTDAQKRLQHDQQFPNEPKQVRSGEQITVSDNRVQVSGETAVMAINERLLQQLLEKNPGTRFAMEESFSFPSTYLDAAPLGPVMELRAKEGAQAVTPERVTQALEYWGARAQELGSPADPNDAPEVRAAWAKMAAAQGKLFLAHDYAGEAEQTFRVAEQMAPGTPQVVLPFVNLLVQQRRFGEAIPVLERALEVAPGNANFQQLLSSLQAQQ